MRVVAVLFAAALCACASPSDGGSFAHLNARGDTISIVHGLDYGVRAAGLRAIAPVHRTDNFNGHPYEISLSGFVGEGFAVMVHAERVADGSGASNYDNLPLATWPSAAFRVRRMCVALEPGDIEGEHDLEWLRANGFDPAGALALAQAFLTSSDHNREIVISIAVEDVDCANETGIEAALARVRSRVSVTAQPAFR